MPPTRSPEELADTLRQGDRASLARAITLVESHKEEDREFAYEMLRSLMPATGGARRIGVSGPPGVGKSTLIDAYGMALVAAGSRVAVLTIDPSSSVSGGSILGDKSRMGRLAQNDAAFIRPSPSDQALGGIARRTREALFLCEAAGFDRVVVETVGVGQSESRVAGLVDTFLLLVQPGAGDELQGIKKGIVELADVVAVAKADGATKALAREAVAEYSAALRVLDARRPVIALSARTGEGLDLLATSIDEHWTAALASGALQARRDTDAARWITDLAEEKLIRDWRRQARHQGSVHKVAERVLNGELRADLGGAELATRADSPRRPAR